MLSDDRLQQLLRDAHELEAIEAGSVRAVKSTPSRWLMPVAAAVVLGALGAVLVGVLAPSKPKGSGAPVAGGQGGHAPTPRGPKVDTASLLLAVYQNDAGHLSCVNWSAEALKGRAISTLSADELTRMGLAMSCDPQAARILVVGLEGPAGALPDSDDRAHLVAQCLSTTAPCTSGEFNPKTCASAGCLDTAVKVRIESLALK